MNALQQLFKDLPKTFYSSAFYQELILARKGIGFGFLLIATLISVLQISLIFMPSMRPLIQQAEEVFQALPDVTLEEGRISVKGETPQTYTLMENDPENALKIVIDPAAQTNDEVALLKKMTDEKILILAAQDRLIIYDRANNRIKASLYDTTKKTTITHDDWVKLGATVKSFFLPTSFLAIAGFVFVSHFITAFLGSILILIVAPLFKTSPGLADAMRLASAAKVPVAVVFLIATPYPPLQAALWFGFVAFGLLAARRALMSNGSSNNPMDGAAKG